MNLDVWSGWISLSAIYNVRITFSGLLNIYVYSWRLFLLYQLKFLLQSTDLVHDHLFRIFLLRAKYHILLFLIGALKMKLEILIWLSFVALVKLDWDGAFVVSLWRHSLFLDKLMKWMNWLIYILRGNDIVLSCFVLWLN